MDAPTSLFDPATYRPPPLHDHPATLEEAIAQCLKAKRTSTQVMDLANVLLWGNPRLKGLLSPQVVAVDKVTRSQLVLGTLFMLDTDVQNGGLSQFLWNCPNWAPHAPASLAAIGSGQIAELLRGELERVASLCGSIEAFSAGASSDVSETLKAYADQAGEISFDDFESAYYAAAEDLYPQAVSYVRAHLDEFVMQRRHGESG